MGMFDYIEYTELCWKCGEPLKDFQSKDGPCLMSTLSPANVHYFYTSCDNEKCKAWNEFSVVVTGYRVERVKDETRES